MKDGTFRFYLKEGGLCEDICGATLFSIKDTEDAMAELLYIQETIGQYEFSENIEDIELLKSEIVSDVIASKKVKEW